MCFQANDTSHSWETWHKHFRHVSYSSLCRLYQEKMVNGLTVDPNLLLRPSLVWLLYHYDMK